MPKPVILVADDQDSIRLLVTASIGDDDYDVIETEDGDSAWAIIQDRSPDLVILDVQMPGRTGTELARAIRADDRLKSTSIILLSAKTQDADVSDGLDAGADHYLTKPFLPSDLVDLVERLLRA